MTTWTPRFECPSFADPNFVNTGYGGNNTYPAVQSNGCVIPNCTGYAYGRELEAGTASGLPTNSNAIDWYNAYTGNKGDAPALGGVMCFGGGYGHVAVVEQIVDANTIVCSESNYGGVAFELVTRTSGNDWKRQGSSHPYSGCLYCAGTDATAGGTPIGGLPSTTKTFFTGTPINIVETVNLPADDNLTFYYFKDKESKLPGYTYLNIKNYVKDGSGTFIINFNKDYLTDDKNIKESTAVQNQIMTNFANSFFTKLGDTFTLSNGNYFNILKYDSSYYENVRTLCQLYLNGSSTNKLINSWIWCVYLNSRTKKLCIGVGSFDGDYDPYIHFYDKQDTSSYLSTATTQTENIGSNTSDPNNGNSNSAGGNKSDVVNDDIDISGLPAISALGAGMFQMFNPNAAQIAALSGFLWSSAFSLDSFKKLFSDPMQAILSLSLTPATPTVSTATDVVIGNVSSGINMPPVTSQYVQADMGSVTINEIWGNSLDYSPTTRVSIYLPYIGIRQLDVDDVMRSTIHLVYNIDLFTGQAVAQIHIARDNTNSVLYEFTGNVNTSVPLTASNYNSLINGIMSAGLAIGATAVSGGAAAPAASLAITSGINVMGNKSVIQRGGSSNGNTGALGQQTPYLIFQRPVQSMPEQYAHLEGFPANYSCTLGSISGYTEVEQIVISGTYATDEENKEIETLLKGGVYL